MSQAIFAGGRSCRALRENRTGHRLARQYRSHVARLEWPYDAMEGSANTVRYWMPCAMSGGKVAH